MTEAEAVAAFREWLRSDQVTKHVTRIVDAHIKAVRSAGSYAYISQCDEKERMAREVTLEILGYLRRELEGLGEY
ncbi:MAG: hypothetical protein MRY72_12245 [Aquisalinus sp.]|nr:hypothetical protein [Aquisalinus sp.]